MQKPHYRQAREDQFHYLQNFQSEADIDNEMKKLKEKIVALKQEIEECESKLNVLKSMKKSKDAK